LNASLFGQQIISNPCGDLFISELTAGVNNDAEAQELNYAIELYNSSGSSINLVDYELKIKDNSNIIISLPLNGIINSHQCFVITNSNADLNLLSLSQLNSGVINFNGKTRLELVKNGIVVDQIGSGITNLNNPSFDLALFIADPIGYLSSFSLNLEDIQNIDIRRNFFVKQGDPTFTTSEMYGRWFYNINSDRSDIGLHNSACFPNGDGNVLYVGWSYPDAEFCVTEPASGTISCYSNDPMILTFTEQGAIVVDKVMVKYKPLRLSSIANPNIMHYTSTNPNFNALGLWPLLSSNATVINPGSSTTPPEVDYSEFINVSSNNCWMTLTANENAPNILASYFNYKYEFDLTNNVVFPNTNTYNHTIEIPLGSEKHYVTVTKGGGDAGLCPLYITGAKNIQLNPEIKFSQSESVLKVESVNDEKFDIKFVNINGAIIMQGNNSGEYSVQTSSLSRGVYLLKLIFKNNIVTKKVVIN
jgi:hypothetical protein